MLSRYHAGLLVFLPCLPTLRAGVKVTQCAVQRVLCVLVFPRHKMSKSWPVTEPRSAEIAMREGDRGTTWSLPAYLLGQGALPLTHSALQSLIGQLRPSPRLPAPTPQGDISGKAVR